MARVPKADNNLQVFRGSLPRADVFTQNAGDGCCPDGVIQDYDKLGQRTRFSNGLAHSNPIGANDKWSFRHAFTGEKDQIVSHINEEGVGQTVSVLAVPTYAFVTGVGVYIEAEEPGLTFNLITRNGLTLPTAQLIQVSAAMSTDNPCELERTQAAGSFSGFGALGTNQYILILGRDGAGQFSLEADEIILEVATMPADGIINGTFDLEVAVSYEIIKRAEA